MFALLSRPVARRTAHSLPQFAARAASSKAPPPPNPPSNTKPTSSQSSSDAAASSSSSSSPAPTPSEGQEPPTQNLSSLPSLDVHTEEDRPQRTGAKSAKDTMTTSDLQRRNISRIMTAILLTGLGLNVVYMGRDWDEAELQEKKMRIEDAPSTRWARTKERFNDLFDYFNKPSWPELLPPPMPAPHQKPYTLLISMDDLLVTSTWDRQHGWRTAKRPGVDYFLAYLSQFYEIVIFTTQNHYTALPVLEKLDRYNFYINYRLFRDATRSLDGKIVKDLSYLNRDLSKVISLDTSEEHTSTHPENAVILPKWQGDAKDRGLVAMIPFLESIAIFKPQDVRPILNSYKDKDIPIEWAKQEAEAKRRHIEEWQKKGGGKSGAGSLTFSGLFGGSSTAAAPVIPLTYLEQKRKEAQAQYKEEQAFIASHKDELEKLMKQDEEAMAAQVPGNLWEALAQMQGAPPQAGAPPAPTSSQAPGNASLPQPGQPGAPKA